MYANTDVYNHPLFRSFKNTQDKEPSSNTDEVIKIIVASNLHHQDSSEASCSHVLTVMTMIVFCTCRYNCSQCTNHGCKLLRTTFQMCLIHWTHRHSIAVVVFDSNDLSWLSLEVPLWFIGRVSYYLLLWNTRIYITIDSCGQRFEMLWEFLNAVTTFV